MVDDAAMNAKVESAMELVRVLDSEGQPPRAALWVRPNERAGWKLWLLPNRSAQPSDVQEAFLSLARILSRHRAQIPGLDLEDIEIVDDAHKTVQGFLNMFSVEGVNSVRIANCVFNDMRLPEAIVLRLVS